eukprot:6172388-Pleurochrysis_carterae.AAC.2
MQQYDLKPRAARITPCHCELQHISLQRTMLNLKPQRARRTDSKTQLVSEKLKRSVRTLSSLTLMVSVAVQSFRYVPVLSIAHAMKVDQKDVWAAASERVSKLPQCTTLSSLSRVQRQCTSFTLVSSGTAFGTMFHFAAQAPAEKSTATQPLGWPVGSVGRPVEPWVFSGSSASWSAFAMASCSALRPLALRPEMGTTATGSVAAPKSRAAATTELRAKEDGRVESEGGRKGYERRRAEWLERSRAEGLRAKEGERVDTKGGMRWERSDCEMDRWLCACLWWRGSGTERAA